MGRFAADQTAGGAYQPEPGRHALYQAEHEAFQELYRAVMGGRAAARPERHRHSVGGA